MSRVPEQLLRAALRAEPPEALDRLVTERVLAVVEQQALDAAARSRRAQLASAIGTALRLRWRQGWRLVCRLARQLSEPRAASKPNASVH